MEPLSAILVGIDFTSTSRLVLEKAARIARSNGAKLTVLHVVDADRFQRYRATRRGDVSSEQVLASARSRLAEIVGKHDLADVELSAEVLLGHPFSAIQDLVAARGIDLVVLSAHDAHERRLGPVASKCVRRTAADILLVRDWHVQSYERIAACIDFSDTSRRALAQAVRIAKQDGARLDLLHVVYPPSRDFAGQALYQRMDDRLSFEEEIEREVREEMEAFTAPFAADLEGIDCRTVILQSTHAALEITSYLKREESDLVALGTTGQSGVMGLLLGSNAERLIHDAPCSVLAVKPDEEQAT